MMPLSPSNVDSNCILQLIHVTDILYTHHSDSATRRQFLPDSSIILIVQEYGNIVICIYDCDNQVCGVLFGENEVNSVQSSPKLHSHMYSCHTHHTLYVQTYISLTCLRLLSGTTRSVAVITRSN